MNAVLRLRRMLGKLRRRLAQPPLEELPDVPDLFHVYRALAAAPDLRRVPGGWIYRGGFYPDYLTVGGASHAIARTALAWCEGNGIDVGAGLWPLPGALPIDLERGPGAARTIDDIPDGSLDFVFSSHCLEHIVDWRAALRAWVGKLRPGGIVFLYLPHPDCAIWHPGAPFVGSGHAWKPEPGVIAEALAASGCSVVAGDEGPDAMCSFHVCARRNA